MKRDLVQKGGEGQKVEGCTFVTKRDPEDVDPENKSTVLRFHHGKRPRSLVVCIQFKNKDTERWRLIMGS